MLSDKQQALIEATRDYEAAVYRDLPKSNDRVFSASVSVESVLQTVVEAMGLKGRIRVERPAGGLRWEKE